MAIYNDVMRHDIITMARGLLESKVLNLRDDGKLELSGAMGWDTPWHHVTQGDRVNCHLWNTVMYQHLFKRLPFSVSDGQQWVPSGCLDCFKVVVRPPTLKALFALVGVQKRLGRDCKCGIEKRAHVFGLYGGYFYNRGMQEGLDCYKEVRAAVDADPELGPGVKVILKRGCTEIEHEVGPSDKWALHENQVEIEQLIYRAFNTDHVMRHQSKRGVRFVHGRWIRFAYQWGDETVLDYIDPEKPLYPPYVTYHHLADEVEEVPE